MSEEGDESRSMAESLPDADAPTKPSYRSFKKKFAKLKINFELRMKESEKLIQEELRIEDLSKRIQEQNDQLLEILLEFNNSLQISPNIRFDLSASGDEPFLPTPERELSPAYNDPASASSMLKGARADLANGNMTYQSYQQLEETVKRHSAFAPQKHYTSLTKTPHSAPPDGLSQFGENSLEYKLGFLTPENENHYYTEIDARLGDEAAALQLSRAPDKPSLGEREREIALKSPVSVHHWLRKHQPNIFLQDNENASEKSTSRPSNLRTSKRAANTSRKDDDTHDEDSVMMDAGPTSGASKGKRKRDEEATPRAKGGSSRPSRKKKDDSNPTPKRPAKRSSGVGA